MRRIAVIGYLVAHARREPEPAPVFQFCFKLAFQNEKDVASLTPMIGHIAGAVFDHANAQVTYAERAPYYLAALARMLDRGRATNQSR